MKIMKPGMLYECDSPVMTGAAITYFRRMLAELGYQPEVVEQLLAIELADITMTPQRLMDTASSCPRARRRETGIERMEREQWLADAS